MNNEEQYQILQDIQQWLRTNPSVDDIKFYISRIPEEHIHLLTEAGLNLALQHAYEVRQYFNQNGMSWITDELSMTDQHTILAYFSGYSQKSVLEVLGKQYPGKPLTPPGDIHVWGRDQLNLWLVSTMFLAVLEFNIQNSLRQSVLTTAPTEEKRQQLEVLLEEALKADKAISERNDQPSEKEFTALKNFLAGLKFIPEAQQLNLLDLIKEADRGLLYFRVGAVLTVEKVARAHNVNPEHLLIEYNRLLSESVCYRAVERERRDWLGTYRSDSDLSSMLASIVDLDQIASGQSRQELEKLATSLSPERQRKLQSLAAEFCPDSFFIDDFMSPLSAAGFYDDIAQLSDEKQIASVIQDLIEVFEEDELPTLKGIAGLFYSISHNLTSRA